MADVPEKRAEKCSKKLTDVWAGSDNRLISYSAYILGLEDFTDPFPCWKQIHRFSAEQHLQMRRTVPPGRAQAGGLAPTRRYQLWARNPSSRAQTPIDSNSDFSIAVWSKLQSVSVQHAKFICQNSKLKKKLWLQSDPLWLCRWAVWSLFSRFKCASDNRTCNIIEDCTTSVKKI